MLVKIDFGSEIVREYVLSQEIVDEIMKGGSVVIETKHPAHGEMFTVKTREKEAEMCTRLYVCGKCSHRWNTKRKVPNVCPKCHNKDIKETHFEMSNEDVQLAVRIEVLINKGDPFTTDDAYRACYPVGEIALNMTLSRKISRILRHHFGYEYKVIREDGECRGVWN